MSVLDVICLGAALLVCLYPLVILGASLRGLSERLMQIAMAGRSFWRRRRLERVYPALRPGAPALAAGVADGVPWEIRAVPLGAGEIPAGLSVRAGPVETPMQRLTAQHRSALSRVDALAVLSGDTPARLEMALFLPDRDTLRELFWRAGRVDVMQKALAGVDDDLFGVLATEVFGEMAALPPADFWKEMDKNGLFRVRLLAEQAVIHRRAEALPQLTALLGRCPHREGAASNRWNHIRLCDSLLSAFAAIAPPGEASEDAVLPFLDSREPQVELAAIRVLGMVGTARSVPLLRRRIGALIRDARGRIAAEAIAAIRQRSGGSGGELMVAEGGGLMVAEGGGVSLGGGLSTGGEGGRDE